MLSTNLREQSSIMARVLHLVDCLIVVGYLFALVNWYRVPWSIYYSRLTIITFIVPGEDGSFIQNFFTF